MSKDEVKALTHRGRLGIEYLIKRLGETYSNNDFKVLALFEDMMLELEEANALAVQTRNMYDKLKYKTKGYRHEHL